MRNRTRVAGAAILLLAMVSCGEDKVAQKPAVAFEGTIVLAGGFSLFMANSVLMPLWLQQHMGYTAMLSGATVAPVGILSIVLTPWVGRNLHTVGRSRTSPPTINSPSSTATAPAAPP